MVQMRTKHTWVHTVGPKLQRSLGLSPVFYTYSFHLMALCKLKASLWDFPMLQVNNFQIKTWKPVKHGSPLKSK